MPQRSSVRINGRALRALRIARGLEVKQLAAKVGRHPQSVRRLETGKGKLASDVFAQQLANALDVEPAEFTEAGVESAGPAPSKPRTARRTPKARTAIEEAAA